MEIQLQELINQIKKDGVETAENQAKAIVDAAKAEAEKIVAEAKENAEKIISDAKIENEKLVKSSEDAIKQAGRNLLISFRESLVRELGMVINENVGTVYSSNAMIELIANVIEAWASKPEATEISVILNSDTLKKLEEGMLSALKERLSKGVVLKANDNFDGGFRIAANDSGAYYDYSAQAVVNMLSNYLSPRVTALLKEAQ